MKRESLVQVAIAVLSVLFVLVCGLVVLSRGNPRMVRAKLRLGALIINLTPVVAGVAMQGCITCYAGPWEPPPVAMAVVVPEPVTAANGTPELTVVEGKQTHLEGELRSSSGTAINELDPAPTGYSFKLCNGFPLTTYGSPEGCGEHAATVLSGNLAPEDGALDEAVEEFRIPLDPAVATPGEYTLELHDAPVESLPSQGGARVTYKLTVQAPGEP